MTEPITDMPRDYDTIDDDSGVGVCSSVARIILKASAVAIVVAAACAVAYFTYSADPLLDRMSASAVAA